MISVSQQYFGNTIGLIIVDLLSIILFFNYYFTYFHDPVMKISTIDVYIQFQNLLFTYQCM